MKDIVTKIYESKEIKWQPLEKKLSDDTMRFILFDLSRDPKTNNYLSMEDIENRFWKGDMKDKVDEVYDRLMKEIYNKENGVDIKDVIVNYGLARSGKQSKIDVIGQTCGMLHKAYNANSQKYNHRPDVIKN